ncbi:MAG TPA: hypothetical protein DCL66_14915 [Gammaproteobacteria bacterium]|nr:hypothetical protein [Gammaproteobacteria bacterium]
MFGVGDTIKQPRSAQAPERLSEEGSQYFKHGKFARKYTETVRKNGVM